MPYAFAYSNVPPNPAVALCLPDKLFSTLQESNRLLENLIRRPSLYRVLCRYSPFILELILYHSHLDIKNVKIEGKEVKWNLGSRFEPYGSPLFIELPSQESGNVELDVCSPISRMALI